MPDPSVPPDHPVRDALGQLAEYQPSPADTERALQQTQQHVNQYSNTPEAHGLSPWARFTKPLALAAALLLAATATWLAVTLTPSTSVAEQLRQVAQANTAFNGWIRVDAEITPPPHTNKDLSHLTRIVSYMRTDATVLGTVMHTSDGQFKAQFHDLNAQQTTGYDSQTQILATLPLPEHMADVLKASNPSDILSVQGFLDRIKSDEKIEDLQPTMRLEDGLKRFDLRIPPSDPGQQAQAITLWADPETDLVKKVHLTDNEGNRQRFTVAHNVTPLTSIHDLGVPRDAPVVDHTQSPAQAVFDAIDHHRDRGLGDHSVILTATAQFTAARNQTAKPHTLQLMAQRGNDRLSLSYDLGNPEDAEVHTKRGWHPKRLVSPPQGWPTPSPAQTLAAIAGKLPREAIFQRGDQYTYAAFSNSGEKLPGPTNANPRMLQLSLKQMAQARFAERHVWPQRFDIPGRTHTLIPHPDQPGVLGLQSATPDKTPPPPPWHVYWIDPARNHVLVGGESHHPSDKASAGYVRQRTAYTHQQRPNGTWVPTAWSRIVSRTLADQGEQEQSRVNYHMQWFSVDELDPSWFDNLPELLDALAVPTTQPQSPR